MVTQINHFINGKLVTGSGGRKLPVFNPATGEQTGSVLAANANDVSEDVNASQPSSAELG